MTHILIVEDEPLIAMMLADWITELGKQPVGPARSVSEALDLIDKTPIDGAVLDVNLGHERCDAVAERLTDKRIPFVLTTGESGEGAHAAFKHVGKLMKPYDFEAIETAVAALSRAGEDRRPAA